jgi:resuscitation-promoting factor RpfB
MSILAHPPRSQSRAVVLPSAATLLAIVPLIALFMLWGLWRGTAIPVRVDVDGLSEEVYTHRQTVAPLLRDLGLQLQPSDQLAPEPATALRRNLVIVIKRARPFRVLADGRDLAVASWGETPRAILRDAQVAVDKYDQVLVDGNLVGMDEALPAVAAQQLAATYDRGFAWEQIQTPPLQLRLRRAIPITVDDGSLPYVVRTTAETIGEALRQAEITLYLGDRVQPSLGSQVSTGLRVFIERSIPLRVEGDNRLFKTRTRAKTVADALTELRIGLSGLDMVTPTLSTKLFNNISIQIKRVQEEIEVKEKIIPFETVFEPDPRLPIDTQTEVSPGAPGITRQRTRVRYENGQEVARTLQDSWVAQEAKQRIVAYGQLIEPQSFTTADGAQITYWRKVRMFASSYSASTAGVSPNSPTYGLTYTGERMRTGIVAVDPRVVRWIRGRGYSGGMWIWAMPMMS